MRLPWTKCDHRPPEEMEEWVRNEPVVGWFTDESGEKTPVGGMRVRCRRCGAEYTVMVG